MKKLVTFIVLTLAALSTAAQQNPQLAEAEWAAAEQAYATGRYEDALRHLDKTQEYVGYWIYTVSHLRILCYDKLDAYFNAPQYLDEFVSEVQRYRDYANNNYESNDFDHNRTYEVYTIHKKIESLSEFAEGLRLYHIGDYAQAFPKFQVAAENGWEVAMFILGFMYINGEGVTQDYAKAREWYEKSADKGNDDAMYALSMIYHLGNGVTQDAVEATKWLRKAAENGHAGAMASLGHYYETGAGGTFIIDKAQAVEWYRKSAEKGDEYGMYRLGLVYYDGIGVTQDRNEGVRWIRLAAENGSDYAKEWLAKNVR